jgi:hypothetical protein
MRLRHTHTFVLHDEIGLKMCLECGKLEDME